MTETEKLCKMASEHEDYLRKQGMFATADLIHTLVLVIAELTAAPPPVPEDHKPRRVGLPGEAD